eukprot:gnl/MRDRNA2_/MRDRNA2_28513_c0_seq1.p1 gnl/MRDRNA2_/MRDRNA2_28513_c0~~gnl/MRDRNA2_/MRDRNA2_28513_c0_seq1.p1  ORF type:complete len:336 (-),score=57.11 gnl/MRDRNA2_/MRDRNA2_28513_c0_seq1:108-1115(-)
MVGLCSSLLGLVAAVAVAMLWHTGTISARLGHANNIHGGSSLEAALPPGLIEEEEALMHQRLHDNVQPMNDVDSGLRPGVHPHQQGQVHPHQESQEESHQEEETNFLSSVRARVVDETCHEGAPADSVAHDAAIVMLTPGPIKGDRDDWKKTMNALGSLPNLGDKGRADVRLFYDDDDPLTGSQIKEASAAVGKRNLCAVRISFVKFPNGMKEQSRTPWWRRNKWGYMHMIRFFFVDLLDDDDPNTKPILNGYNYWMRIDTDSKLTHPVNVDPFHKFDADSALGYMHHKGNRDCGESWQVFMAWLPLMSNNMVVTHARFQHLGQDPIALMDFTTT